MILRKKPNFSRKDWHKRLNLGKRLRKAPWRAAKGAHNKTRLGKRGNPKRPKIGWSLGKKKNSEEFIRIENAKELSNLKEGSRIIISSRVGKRKREEILNKAKGMKIQIFNLKGGKNEVG